MGSWARVRRVCGGGGDGAATADRADLHPLADRLAARGAAGEWRVTLTFAQVEAVIERLLPVTARDPRGYRPWWRGRGDTPHAWYGWQRVDWTVEAVELAAETVTFARPAEGAGVKRRCRTAGG